jgi:tRNA-binding protein
MKDETKFISAEDFYKLEIRVGTIISAEPFEEAIKPAYKIQIDFGERGIKKTSAQITDLYKKEDLLNKQIIAVINFPPKQIARYMSECLILGIMQDNNEVVLLRPDKKVTNGLQIC